MLIIRITGMASNIYISARAGASSMGIYHLIFSVFTFGITFAGAGTGFSVTRLISEGNRDEKSVVKKSLLISSVTSFAAFSIFFFGAEFFENSLVQKEGAATGLRILAFALPCMAVSSVCRGYFTAKRRAVIITLSSILEETVCTVISILLVNRLPSSLSYMCLVWGCAASNAVAFVFDSICMSVCLNKTPSKASRVRLKDILTICVPIAAGSYIRTGLVAAENLMIPARFARFGLTDAVGEYGVIKAMTLPVMLFPAVFIHAFSSLLVPEMSEMSANCRKNGICHVANLSFNVTTMFGFFVSLMLFKYHDIIANEFFEDSRVSDYIRLLSLLAVPMYLDTVADSILKGMGLQNSSLVYNITDSAMRLVFIAVLVQKGGPLAYIMMLYVSEIFNLSLSIRKVISVSGLKPDFITLVLIPLISFVSALPAESPLICGAIYIGVYYVLSKFN